jgi:hypothetical protein
VQLGTPTIIQGLHGVITGELAAYPEYYIITISCLSLPSHLFSPRQISAVNAIARTGYFFMAKNELFYYQQSKHIKAYYHVNGFM